ncbi:hypothetical protein WKW50_16225 [Ochrobactrum sp. GPK 3]
MNEALKVAWHDNTVRMQDEPLTLLVQSYRWYRLRNRAWFSPHGPVRGPIDAVTALRNAREDVEAGKRRYPADAVRVYWQSNDNPRSRERLGYVESPEKIGLRLVGNVTPECGGRNGYWHDGERFGWYADSYDENRVYGIVYQLPGRGGKARFLAGFKSINESGVTIDFGTVFEEPAAYWEPVRKETHGTYGGYWNYQIDPCVMDAALTAARNADDMAKRCAEHEQEYDRAWQAGNMWQESFREIADKRKEALALLADRRAARSAGLKGYDSICGAIRKSVTDICDDIRQAREKMQALADGDYSAGDTYLGFYTGNGSLRAAFNDGAGETILA